jgi:hypothetical protein
MEPETYEEKLARWKEKWVREYFGDEESED